VVANSDPWYWITVVLAISAATGYIAIIRGNKTTHTIRLKVTDYYLSVLFSMDAICIPSAEKRSHGSDRRDSALDGRAIVSCV